VHNTLLFAYAIVAQGGVEPADGGTIYYIKKGLSPPSLLSFGAHEPKSPIVHLPTKYADSIKPMEKYMLQKLADRGVAMRAGYYIYDSATQQCTCWTAVYSGERNQCKCAMAAELCRAELRKADTTSVALETAAVAAIRDFAMQITAREKRIPKELQDPIVVSSNSFSVYHHVFGLAKAAEAARVVDEEQAASLMDSLRGEDLGDILAGTYRNLDSPEA
jgi:hypothetical protein